MKQDKPTPPTEEVLRRMLNTPPRPHPKAQPKLAAKAKKK